MCVTVTNYNQSHDHISILLDVPAKSFESMHQKESQKLKNLFQSYIESLLSKKTARQETATTLGAAQRSAVLNIDPDTGKVTLPKDADGFPIIPDQWCQNGMNKATLEQLWTAYIGNHYREQIYVYTYIYISLKDRIGNSAKNKQATVSKDQARSGEIL